MKKYRLNEIKVFDYPVFGISKKEEDGSIHIVEYDRFEHFTGQQKWMLIYDEELNLMKAYQSDDNYYHWGGYIFKIFVLYHESTSDIPNIDDVETDVAMVADANNLYQHLPCAVEFCQNAGFSLNSQMPYFNSGVVYAKDSTDAGQLFSLWHQYWQKSVEKGIPLDQPALCRANIDLGQPILELSEIWNAQNGHFDTGNSRNVKIFHHFNIFRKKCKKEMVFEHIRNNGTRALTNLINNPFTVGLSVFYNWHGNNKLFRYMFIKEIYVYENIPGFYNCLSSFDAFVIDLYLRIHNFLQKCNKMNLSIIV